MVLNKAFNDFYAAFDDHVDYVPLEKGTKSC